jgi:hypothetical protein
MKSLNLLILFLLTNVIEASYLPKGWYEFTPNGQMVTEKSLGEFKGFVATYEDFSSKKFNELKKALSEKDKKIQYVFANFYLEVPQERFFKKENRKTRCYYSVRVDSPKENGYYLALPYCTEG